MPRLRSFRSELRMDEDYEAQLLSSELSDSNLLETALRSTIAATTNVPSVPTQHTKAVASRIETSSENTIATSSAMLVDSGTGPDSTNVGNKQVQTVITMGNESVVPSSNVLHASKINDPISGQTLNLQAAIDCGLIDVKSFKFTDPQTGQGMSLEDAVAKGLVSADLVKHLQQNSGLKDPVTGRELTLKEAMQKGFVDTQTGRIIDPRTGKSMSVTEASQCGLINDNVEDMLSYKSISTSSSSQSRGFYGVDNLQDTNISWTLSEAVQKGLIDTDTGKFIDPISKNHMSITEAIERRLLDGKSKDIVHPITGELISLQEAIDQHVIDPTAGCFIDLKTGEDISLSEALNKSLLKKPSTLYRVMSEGLLDTDGNVKEAETGKKLSLLEAIQKGILDTEMKCILDPTTDEMLSLSEAMKRGLISPSGQYVDPKTGRRMSIQDAVNKGLAQIISEDVSIAASGVKDTIIDENLSLMEAINSGCLDIKSGMFVNKQTGKRIPLEEAVRQGLINKDLKSQLRGDSGITDKYGKGLTVLEAIQQNMFNPTTGEVYNPNTGQFISLEEAISAALLTPNQAKTLLDLTSPIVATTTITTDITPSKSLNPLQLIPDPSKHPVSVSDALNQGLLDESNQSFTDPNTGRMMPIENAINQGLITLSSQWPDNTDSGALENQNGNSETQLENDGRIIPNGEGEKMLHPIPTHMKLETSDSFVEDIEGGTRTVTHHDKTQYHAEKLNGGYKATSVQEASLTQLCETRRVNITSDMTWPVTLQNAIGSGMVDAVEGMFLEPQTSERLSLHQAILRSYIIPTSATFKDPVNSSQCNIEEAIDEKYITDKAQYYSRSSRKHLNLEELIKRDIIVFSELQQNKPGNMSVIAETRNLVVDSVVDPRTGEVIDTDEAADRGLIDIKQGIFTDPRNGDIMSISEAIEKGFLKTNTEQSRKLVSKTAVKEVKTFTITGAVDPNTGEVVDVNTAVKAGIIDQANGLYHGKDELDNPISISISDAIKRGYVIADKGIVSKDVTAVKEAPYLRETQSFTIKGLIDPTSGKEITVSEAIKLGVLDQQNGLYVNPQTGETIVITEAVKAGLIFADVSESSQATHEPSDNKITSSRHTVMTLESVIDPISGKNISVQDAIQRGLLDLENGTFKDPITNTIMSIDEAIKLGFLKTKLGEPELQSGKRERLNSLHIDDDLDAQEDMAVEEIREETKKFEISGVTDPITGKMIDLNEALLKGIVNEEQGIFKNPQTGVTMPITEALNQGLIVGQLESKVNEREVFKSSIVASHIPSNVQIVGVFNPISKQFVSPSIALKMNLIDQDKSTYFDISNDNKLPINEAIKRDLVKVEPKDKRASYDNATEETQNKPKDDIVTLTFQSTKKNDSNVDRLTIEDPLELNMQTIADSSPEPMSFENAVKLGLYDVTTRMFRDPVTGKTMSLNDAVAQGLIDPCLPALRDIRTGTVINLEDAIKRNLVTKTGELYYFVFYIFIT